MTFSTFARLDENLAVLDSANALTARIGAFRRVWMAGAAVSTQSGRKDNAGADAAPVARKSV